MLWRINIHGNPESYVYEGKCIPRKAICVCRAGTIGYEMYSTLAFAIAMNYANERQGR